jgi:hypothetical protein
MLNPLHTFFVLFAAFSAIFIQTTVNSLRGVAGAQVDLLPSLMVYASLSSGMPTVAGLAIGGGLLLDSQSANPLDSFFGSKGWLNWFWASAPARLRPWSPFFCF